MLEILSNGTYDSTIVKLDGEIFPIVILSFEFSLVAQQDTLAIFKFQAVPFKNTYEVNEKENFRLEIRTEGHFTNSQIVFDGEELDLVRSIKFKCSEKKFELDVERYVRDETEDEKKRSRHAMTHRVVLKDGEPLVYKQMLFDTD